MLLEIMIITAHSGAFLNGQVECPSKRFDIPIYMCVSLEALCVICKQEHVSGDDGWG